MVQRAYPIRQSGGGGRATDRQRPPGVVYTVLGSRLLRQLRLPVQTQCHRLAAAAAAVPQHTATLPPPIDFSDPPRLGYIAQQALDFVGVNAAAAAAAPRHVRRQAYMHHRPRELLWRAERKPRYGGALGYSCGVNSGAPRRRAITDFAFSACLELARLLHTNSKDEVTRRRPRGAAWRTAALHRCSRVARAAPRSLRSEQVVHNAAH